MGRGKARGGNPLADCVRACGRNLPAALLLYRLNYWAPYATEGWVANTWEQWAAETGLSPSQVRRAARHLRTLGLVEARTTYRLREHGQQELRVYEIGQGGVDDSGHPPCTPVDTHPVQNCTPSHTKGAERYYMEVPHGGAQVIPLRGPKDKKTVAEVAQRLAQDTAPPTEAQVLAQAAQARSLTELLHVWRDAQRVRRPGWVPSLEANGKAKGYVRALDRALPEGTLGTVLALLGARWDSFCSHLVAERGWPRDKLGAPSLALAASQPEAVCTWVAKQDDAAPDEVPGDGDTPNAQMERLFNES